MKRSVFHFLSVAAIAAIVSFSSILPGTIRAQFRAPNPTDAADNKPKTATEAMTGDDDGDSFFSQLFNPARWSDHSSYSMSYMTGGGSSLGLAMYTNTLSYMVNPNLHFSADISAVYSPFSSFGNLPGSSLGKSINGIYLSDARLDWKVGNNTTIMIQYIGGPGPNTMPYYMPGFLRY